jgi:uncharacterized protein (TIGR02246 family)
MNVQASPAAEASVEAIGRSRDAHIAALNNGDAEGWVAGFIDDGVQMPPGFPVNKGKEAIRAWSSGFLAQFDVEFAISPDEVEVVSPDWAFETGTWEISLAPKGGGDVMRDAGKHISIYRRQPDDTWLMARDIWNSSNPPPGVP